MPHCGQKKAEQDADAKTCPVWLVGDTMLMAGRSGIASRSNPYANKPAIAMTFLPVILAAR